MGRLIYGAAGLAMLVGMATMATASSLGGMLVGDLVFLAGFIVLGNRAMEHDTVGR
jgi:hypothetical protein